MNSQTICVPPVGRDGRIMSEGVTHGLAQRVRRGLRRAQKTNEGRRSIQCVRRSRIRNSGAKVARDEVAGWVVFLPHEPNHTGMMGVFCPVCFELGSEVITDKTVEHMMEF